MSQAVTTTNHSQLRNIQSIPNGFPDAFEQVRAEGFELFPRHLCSEVLVVRQVLHLGKVVGIGAEHLLDSAGFLVQFLQGLVVPEDVLLDLSVGVEDFGEMVSESPLEFQSAESSVESGCKKTKRSNEKIGASEFESFLSKEAKDSYPMPLMVNWGKVSVCPDEVFVLTTWYSETVTEVYFSFEFQLKIRLRSERLKNSPTMVVTVAVAPMSKNM